MTDGTKRPAVPEAIALRYDGKNAPRVTAKGKGCTAEEILARARAHDVPLYEDAQLAALLARLDLGETIPAMLYAAVAEVIAFAYLVRAQAADRPVRGPRVRPPSSPG